MHYLIKSYIVPVTMGDPKSLTCLHHT